MRNCSVCGRLLASPEGVPCPDCLAAEEEALRKVAAYLAGGGSPALAAVVAGAGVPMKMLRRLLEAGRLALQGDPAPATCMLCGRPLGGSTERLCPACGADLRRGGEMGRPRGEVRGYHSRQAPLRGAGRPRHDARA